MNNLNYLFSTTRQWNPGDEIILLGLINLLNQKGKIFNPIIFNRSPVTRPGYLNLNPFSKMNIKFYGSELLDSFFRIGFNDNSFKPFTSPDVIDKIYIAGSPEWFVYRLNDIFKLVKDYNIPIEYYGLGSHKKFTWSKLSSNAQYSLKNAKIVTVRDELTLNRIGEYCNAKLISCPSLFSANNIKKISRVNKIGLIFSTHNTVKGNNISKESSHELLKIYKEIIKNTNYDFSFICHYIDELEECKKHFPKHNIKYHYDSREYLNIYENFDFVLGARIHGIACAISQEIPGMLLTHDERAGTGKHFGIPYSEIKFFQKDEFFSILNNPKLIDKIISNIIKVKKKAFDNYMDIL